jgi:hypothetical protein
MISQSTTSNWRRLAQEFRAQRIIFETARESGQFTRFAGA